MNDEMLRCWARYHDDKARGVVLHDNAACKLREAKGAQRCAFAKECAWWLAQFGGDAERAGRAAKASLEV